MEIPEDYQLKSKEEIYADLYLMSAYVSKLKDEIENLKAQLTLKKGEVIKKRGEILGLKSEIGHQNIKIQQLNDDKSNIIDIDFNIEDYE